MSQSHRRTDRRDDGKILPPVYADLNNRKRRLQMCGHKKMRKHERTAETGSYEGETIRLGTPAEATGVQSGAGRSWKHVPWWTLWLIWPLFGLIKPMLQALATAGA